MIDKNRKILCILLLFFFSRIASASQPEVVASFHLAFDGKENPPSSLIAYKKISRPKIGLTLSGGGLRGIAQIGVIRALEENNIPIDCIVGTSIGALIGGLYASGYTSEEIWKISEKINWAEILRDSPERSAQYLGEKQKRSRAWVQFRLDGFKPYIPEAYTPGQRLIELLTDLFLNAPFHSPNFIQLPIPLRVIATDILSGKKVVFQRGDLVEAIRASIAIPLLFSPVNYDTMLLADGGLLDNIPVEETRKSGADIVIAVNTTALLRSKDEIQAPWELADQVTTIMQREHNLKQLQMADVVISFKDMQIKSTDSGDPGYLFEEGVRRASEKIEEIKKLIAQKEKISRKDSSHYFIRRTQINYSGKFEPDFPLPRFSGQSVSGKEILESLKTLYGTGSLQNASATIVRDSSGLILHFNLTPNPILKKIEFLGNSVFSVDELRRPFESLLGQPINYHKGKAALKEIIKLYRAKGYSLAQISEITFAADSSLARVHISEGRIHSVHFDGNKKTKDFVIAREFTLKSGQIFQFEKAHAGIDNVYATGLFRSVVLKATQFDRQTWDISLHLQEKRPYVMRVGGKYDRERNGRAFVEVSDENFMGTGNDLSLHLKYGDRDMGAFVDLRADRIFKTLFTSHLRFHYDRGKYYAYKAFRGVGEYERIMTGATFSLGQQIARFGTLSGLMRFEEISIKSISGTGYDPGTLFIHTLGLNTIVDTRDQVPFPRQGKYYNFYYQVSSGKLFGTDISFFKVQNQITGYFTFKKRNTFRPSIRWGTSDLTTPFSEQFRIGGENSFYGLRDDELIGRHLFLVSFEYRYLFPFKLLFDTYLSMRFDGGAVWENVVEINAEDFINGRGIAISFKTPIGPVSFAYGLASNGRKRVYFSAGYNF